MMISLASVKAPVIATSLSGIASRGVVCVGDNLSLKRLSVKKKKLHVRRACSFISQ
jgi:hypothetical protein